MRERGMSDEPVLVRGATNSIVIEKDSNEA